MTATSDGLLTDMSAIGTTLERSDVAYAVDGRPATVFYGDVPLYRELANGAEGDDVALLEENLAALGYHVADALVLKKVREALTSLNIEYISRSSARG